ncbi:MAG: cytochrome P450 [Rhizobiaceae bacterium]
MKPDYLEFDPAGKLVSIDPRNTEFVQDPYRAYAFLHEAAPAFYWREFGFWCLAGFNDVNNALRDRRLGRERPDEAKQETGNRVHLREFDRVEAHSMLELEPPTHTRLRSLVNRAFVSRQIERLRPQIELLANELIDAFQPAGSVDLLPAFATPVPITIITSMMGLPNEDGAQLLKWSHAMVKMYTPSHDHNTELEANDAAKQFTAYLTDKVAERRQQPGDDLLSVLIAARDQGEKLSDEELISSAILLLNAGHEATVHQTGNAIRTILAQGGDPRRFFDDSASTARTIEECLRIDAPLHMFTRYAYEHSEIAPGLILEPGQQVGLLLGAANRDPRAFADCAKFNPDRGDQKNVSFGAGLHFCIGAPLARLELQASLKVLFVRLPELELVKAPKYSDSYHFHGLEQLFVRW